MSQQENSLINQQNNQPNQELKQLPQQQVYPMQNQPQQNNSSQIIAQQINFDQQNLQQPQQIYQQPYQQHQFQYLQPQQFQQNPQQQMQPQQLQQQNYPQNYQQYYHQYTNPQFVNNDVNQGQPMVQGMPPQQMVQQRQIPQGQPLYKQGTVVPLLFDQPNNAVLSLQPSNTGLDQVLVINDNTLRSADGFRFPTTVICQNCNVKGQTTIQKEASDTTHIFAVILCIACPPFCIVPYLLQECDNIQHYCLRCKSKVGIKEYKLCDSY